MMTLPVRGYTLPSAGRSATEPRSYTLNRDVTILGHQPVVPQPGGVYDINAPCNPKAYFTSKGIRQWNTRTSPAFGGVPTGMKAKYDLLVRADMDNERNKAAPAKIYTIQQQDSVLIGEQILRRAAFREMQNYDDLVQQGLTHEEATKVIRDQMIAKAVINKGGSTRAYHQQMKEVIHQMAAERGVQVGLPQSLATFAGRYAPNAHFAATGIGAVKAALRQQVHDPDFMMKSHKSADQLDAERVVESAQGVRQVPDRNGLPPADAFADLPRMAMQMQMPQRRSRSQSVAEASGVSEGQQGGFFGTPSTYNVESLRARAREMGLDDKGSRTALLARLNVAVAAGAGGGGAMPQPIVEGAKSTKKK